MSLNKPLVNPAESKMRYWLEHEYEEQTKPYLICNHPDALGPYGQHEWLLSHTHSETSGSHSGRWSHRPRNAAADYVRYLVSSGQRLDQADESLEEILARGEGLSLVANQITRLCRQFDEQHLHNLLSLCMGAQYFSVLAADYFPCKSHPAVKLCLFYSYVVLGQQAKAQSLYKEIEPLVDTVCCHINTTAGLVYSNIRCLYLLRCGLSARDVLPINRLLVRQSLQIGHKTFTAILLLNQARLYRILVDQKSSIQLLEESFVLLSEMASFKLRLYYVLQLAMIRGQKQELLEAIYKVRTEQHDGFQCFGWRIARLIQDDVNADMILGDWSGSISKRLMSDNTVDLLLQQLLAIC